MASSARRISFIFIVLSVLMLAEAQNKPPPFPKINELMVEFYQTKVTITDVKEGVISTATEYYDNSGPRGRVDYLAVGNRNSVIYSNDTDEILNINSTSCMATDIEISEQDYVPLFYGWLNRKPLIIGPSAPLWFAQDNRVKIVALKTTTPIRKIDCWKYSLNVTGPKESVMIDYYFATEKWTTPYQLAGLRVPVRIVIAGKSAKYSEAADEWAEINLITDFAYFKPTLDNFWVFRPPLGLGCKLKKATLEMPKVPKAFQYSAEVYDVAQSTKTEISNIEHQEVWYDNTQMVARLDHQKASGSKRELYDFNTGVTYSIVDERTCTIKPLQKSIFEAHRNDRMIGQMKEPNEVMNFDGEFYYMGQRRVRGIWCDTFESLQENAVYADQTLAKLVVTAYYSQIFYKVIVNGEEESQIPVAYTVTGWDTPTTKSIEVQYSIFEFDDVIWPSIAQTFDLDRCFPSIEDKSYFLLIFNVQPELAAKMTEVDNLIVEQLRSKISKIAKLSSDLRLPYLKVDYKETGVYATGLILDRPPAIKQFYMEYEGEVTIADNYLKPIVDADTTEKCAYACVDNDDFLCVGFYMCKQACFLKSKDILEPTTEDEQKMTFGEDCQTWLRATRDSHNELYLLDALQRLEQAVVNGSFTFVVSLGENEEVVVPVKDIVIGDGPFTGNKTPDKPYTSVINYAKLRVEDETTVEVADVDNLNDCYRNCKDADSISCSSFSYCPSTKNKRCMISSRLVVDRKSNPDDTEEDPDCYVYALKYLELFDKYPGKTVPLGGDVGYPKISNVEECAKKCKETKTLGEAEYRCRGFEYCRTEKTCVLHSKHVMDLKPGEITKGKPTCTHYAAKFSADYYDLGYTLIEDFNSDERTEISLEECAKVCSMELKQNCSSFNYCPASEPGATDSKCFPSSLTLKDKGIKTLTKDKCHHFEKKSAVDDWSIATTQGPPVTPTSPSVKTPTSPSGTTPTGGTSPRPVVKKLTLSKEGYTKKGFTGLVIGMLAFGICVGVLGFVGFSYYKSRRTGEGFSVRFSKN